MIFSMKNLILNLFEEEQKPLKIEELLEKLGIEDEKYTEFFSLVPKMVESGLLTYTKKGKLCPPEFLDLFKGEFISISKGGKVLCGEREFLVLRGRDKNAIHGDTVLFTLLGEKAEIIKILKRKVETLTGTYIKVRDGGIIKSENSRHPEIFIPDKNSKGAKQFDKVLCRIISYKEKGAHVGRIEEVFGSDRNLRANYNAILASYGIYGSYPVEATNQAKNIFEKGVTEKDLEGRLDLTGENIFTIDSKDAKDLDDAILVKKVGENYELSVHIADVSHYVTENTPLDKEAFERGTSVYFADQVIPMLPFELSNFICSLNPGEIRLTMSCFMTVNKEGEVIDYYVKKSYIKSRIKGIYSEINDILEDKATQEIKEKYKDLMTEIHNIHELSKIIDIAKEKRGILDFDVPEAKIIIENDKIADIIQRERGISDRIIENFMILANESIAKYMFFTYTPCVYRIHEEPDEAKTNRLIRTAKLLGIKIKTSGGKLYSSSVDMLLKSIKGTDLETVLSAMALRSMQKARYDSECLGHFGLNLQYYLHFTSPIRRYPDLAVHRMLKIHLDGEIEESNLPLLEEFVSSAAEKSSEKEYNATNAERDIDKLYMADFMSDKVGEIFEGIISGVSDFGFFVKLENTIEGLVHVSDLRDDYYEYIEDMLMLRGERKGKTYRLGDKITVQLVKSNITNRQIDFVPWSD